MALPVAQISQLALDTIPKDVVTNVLHFGDHTADAIVDADYATIATDLVTAFDTYYHAVDGAHRGFTVKVYELDDPSTEGAPRRPRATHSLAPVANEADYGYGPRQVASCLSYYSTDNNPRTRGRIYLGPFTGTVLSHERVPSTVSGSALTALVAAISAAGGAHVDWVTYSTRSHLSFGVTHWWMDDRWDTVRKRGLKANSRVTGTTGG